MTAQKWSKFSRWRNGCEPKETEKSHPIFYLQEAEYVCPFAQMAINSGCMPSVDSEEVRAFCNDGDYENACSCRLAPPASPRSPLVLKSFGTARSNCFGPDILIPFSPKVHSFVCTHLLAQHRVHRPRQRARHASRAVQPVAHELPQRCERRDALHGGHAGATERPQPRWQAQLDHCQRAGATLPHAALHGCRLDRAEAERQMHERADDELRTAHVGPEGFAPYNLVVGPVRISSNVFCGRPNPLKLPYVAEPGGEPRRVQHVKVRRVG